MEEFEQVEDVNLEQVDIISIEKFIILSLITFRIYPVWWMYKTWRFFKYKDGLNIMPAPRAFFSLFFLYGLFERIQDFAYEKGYNQEFSSGGYFIGYIFFSLLSSAPDPFWIINIVNIFFIIPAVKAFNYGVENSSEYEGINKDKFTNKQVALLLIGGIFTVLVILSFFLPEV